MITLVTGPPCAGKTTHVAHHATPDDLILCFDQYARAAGSPHHHDHTTAHRELAGHAYDHAINHLAAHGHHTNVWVIRCAPTPTERTALAHRIRADHVLVLVPPLEVALRRARHDRRARRTEGVIRGWYRRYQPAAGEQVITTASGAASRRW